MSLTDLNASAVSINGGRLANNVFDEIIKRIGKESEKAIRGISETQSEGMYWLVELMDIVSQSNISSTESMRLPKTPSVKKSIKQKRVTIDENLFKTPKNNSNINKSEESENSFVLSPLNFDDEKDELLSSVRKKKIKRSKLIGKENFYGDENINIQIQPAKKSKVLMEKQPVRRNPSRKAKENALKPSLVTKRSTSRKKAAAAKVKIKNTEKDDSLKQTKVEKSKSKSKLVKATTKNESITPSKSKASKNVSSLHFIKQIPETPKAKIKPVESKKKRPIPTPAKLLRIHSTKASRAKREFVKRKAEEEAKIKILESKKRNRTKKTVKNTANIDIIVTELMKSNENEKSNNDNQELKDSEKLHVDEAVVEELMLENEIEKEEEERNHDEVFDIETNIVKEEKEVEERDFINNDDTDCKGEYLSGLFSGVQVPVNPYPSKLVKRSPIKRKMNLPDTVVENTPVKETKINEKSKVDPKQLNSKDENLEEIVKNNLVLEEVISEPEKAFNLENIFNQQLNVVQQKKHIISIPDHSRENSFKIPKTPDVNRSTLRPEYRLDVSNKLNNKDKDTEYVNSEEDLNIEVESEEVEPQKTDFIGNFMRGLLAKKSIAPIINPNEKNNVKSGKKMKSLKSMEEIKTFGNDQSTIPTTTKNMKKIDNSRLAATPKSVLNVSAFKTPMKQVSTEFQTSTPFDKSQSTKKVNITINESNSKLNVKKFLNSITNNSDSRENNEFIMSENVLSDKDMVVLPSINDSDLSMLLNNNVTFDDENEDKENDMEESQTPRHSIDHWVKSNFDDQNLEERAILRPIRVESAVKDKVAKFESINATLPINMTPGKLPPFMMKKKQERLAETSRMFAENMANIDQLNESASDFDELSLKIRNNEFSNTLNKFEEKSNNKQATNLIKLNHSNDKQLEEKRLQEESEKRQREMNKKMNELKRKAAEDAARRLEKREEKKRRVEKRRLEFEEKNRMALKKKIDLERKREELARSTELKRREMEKQKTEKKIEQAKLKVMEMAERKVHNELTPVKQPLSREDIIRETEERIRNEMKQKYEQELEKIRAKEEEEKKILIQEQQQTMNELLAEKQRLSLERREILTKQMKEKEEELAFREKEAIAALLLEKENLLKQQQMIEEQKSKEYKNAEKSLEREELNYIISDYESTDDESEEEDIEKPAKKIPSWAKREYLINQLKSQSSVDPDSIFGVQGTSTADLESIFQKKKKKFKVRTSSARWDRDKLQLEDVKTYKQKMGFGN